MLFSESVLNHSIFVALWSNRPSFLPTKALSCYSRWAFGCVRYQC